MKQLILYLSISIGCITQILNGSLMPTEISRQATRYSTPHLDQFVETTKNYISEQITDNWKHQPIQQQHQELLNQNAISNEMKRSLVDSQKDAKQETQQQWQAQQDMFEHMRKTHGINVQPIKSNVHNIYYSETKAPKIKQKINPQHIQDTHTTLATHSNINEEEITQALHTDHQKPENDLSYLNAHDMLIDNLKNNQEETTSLSNFTQKNAQFPKVQHLIRQSSKSAKKVPVLTDAETELEAQKHLKSLQNIDQNLFETSTKKSHNKRLQNYQVQQMRMTEEKNKSKKQSTQNMEQNDNNKEQEHIKNMQKNENSNNNDFKFSTLTNNFIPATDTPKDEQKNKGTITPYISTSELNDNIQKKDKNQHENSNKNKPLKISKNQKNNRLYIPTTITSQNNQKYLYTQNTQQREQEQLNYKTAIENFTYHYQRALAQLKKEQSQDIITADSQEIINEIHHETIIAFEKIHNAIIHSNISPQLSEQIENNLFQLVRQTSIEIQKELTDFLQDKQQTFEELSSVLRKQENELKQTHDSKIKNENLQNLENLENNIATIRSNIKEHENNFFRTLMHRFAKSIKKFILAALGLSKYSDDGVNILSALGVDQNIIEQLSQQKTITKNSTSDNETSTTTNTGLQLTPNLSQKEKTKQVS